MHLLEKKAGFFDNQSDRYENLDEGDEEEEEEEGELFVRWRMSAR